MDKAIHMANEVGVDEFCFMTTTYPKGAASEKYINGLSGTKYEKYDSKLFDIFWDNTWYVYSCRFVVVGGSYWLS